MKKRRILSLCLVAAIAAIAVFAGTLAYFTDTDEADNTFTVGNVKIDLIEQQRIYDDEGNAIGLEAFGQNKKLYPIVGSAQGEKDQFNMPVAKNYVDKMVTVKNTGAESAYIRTYFAIPSVLDDGADTFNAGLNTLHFNFGSKVDGDNKVVTTYGNEWLWKNDDGSWKYFETTIGGIQYNVYYADYATVVAPDETTEQFIQGVYLDKSFNITEDGAFAFGEKLDLDEGWDWNAVSCPVFSIACQSEGFETAAEAFEAAFGANYNPWA